MESELAAATVLDLDGEIQTLASLWKERPAVITFLRHYG